MRLVVVVVMAIWVESELFLLIGRISGFFWPFLAFFVRKINLAFFSEQIENFFDRKYI